MKSKLLHQGGGRRTFALVFDIGEEVMGGLEQFAERERLSAASFSAIGAFGNAIVAFFDWDRKTYQHIPIIEQVEVLTLTGTVSLGDNGRVVHAHVVVGKRDGTAHGGHLMEARVRPTLEVTIEESPEHLVRRHDPRSGLSLIDPALASGDA